jgi:hypothetical protein
MEWLGQLQRNVVDTISQLTLEKYVRLVVIVCAYALLRPYILKLAGKHQTGEHEKEASKTEAAAAAASAAAGRPKPLQDQVQVPEDSDDGEEGEATGADWGKKARRRQRQFVRNILEADEKRRREEEEDKDIEEFLVE